LRAKEDNAAVGAVCRRLDGIPLAIELAAARVRTMPVEAIAERLNDRFRLLTSGDRTALPRQQTLRALIDWSYELLSEDERSVFRRLAVFAGGWTLEAAEAVVAFDTVAQRAVLDLVTQLAEKSLVAMDADQARYRLLDTVREYADERLAEVGEAEETRTRHLHYYVALAEKARPQLGGPKQAQWLARLDVERENLLSAHRWCDQAHDAAETGLKLAFLLRPYWINRGLLGVGHRLTVDALNRPSAKPSSLARCRGLFDAGQLSYFMGRYSEARQYLEQSLRIARELHDHGWIASVLQPLGMAHVGEGDLAGAQDYLEEALERAEQRGDKREFAGAINAIAQLYRVKGRLDFAEPLYGRVLEIARELGDRDIVAVALLNLAMVAVQRRAAAEAAKMLLEVLAIAEQIGSKPAGQGALEVCAGRAVLLGDHAQAARFYGAAQTQAEQSGFHRDPTDEAFLKPLVTRTQAALGAASFTSAEQAGRRLSYEEALAEARDWLTRTF
jgi:non-specific serine/threonine protein kinase